MKQYLYTLSFLFTFLCICQNNYLHQVLLLNEGCYDYYNEEILDPPTVGVYNPETNTYNTEIEIPNARFASDLIIDDGFFYVAADNKILKYNLDTYELINSIDYAGVRKLTIYDDFLFVSRGDYDLETYSPIIFDSYLDVYLKENFSYYYSFDTSNNGPQWSTESLLIVDNKLYIAINNAYEWGNYKGIIGIVDISNMSYSELDLGDDGKNPINMMYRNGNIYTLNNKNWDGSSVSILNLPTSSLVETITLSDVSAGCGVSIIRDDKLNYQKSSETEMHIFNLETLEQEGLVNNLENNYYAVALNPLSDYLYAAIANFTSNSGVLIFDENNNQVNSFFADVATSKIVFDIRNETSSNLVEEKNNLDIIGVSDVLGRSVNDKTPIVIELLQNGDYNKKLIIKK